ncbi:hypothetical protein QOL99_00115 [Deinococcus sp. MIMF12]|uniref:Phage tail protein n=1 Tax=Deinococcus rhizophilus TaxID=3049544 RepID=A0ABT7JBY0_9DEIO|nr:hypothetical protein [Deinococcus rhizophilus]MDL2342552.1 hypothetical protein [Deinococcus rhizophilus]
MKGVEVKQAFVQGDDEEIIFVPFDVDPELEVTDTGMALVPGTGIPADLTGVQFRAKLKANHDAKEAEAEIPPERWRVETRDWGVYGELPTVVGWLPNTVTQAMKALSGVYDVEAVENLGTPDEYVQKPLYGTYTLRREVTT